MTATDPIATPDKGTYRLDPARTTITFTTRHVFGLAPVHGTFQLRHGELVVAADPRASTVTAEIDAASFTTGNSKRDHEVRSPKFLDTERYPAITFAARGPEHADGHWHTAGTLTAHGQSAACDVTVEHWQQAAGELTVRAKSRVDRRAFGVTAMPGMAGRWLTITITAVAAVYSDRE